MTAKNKQTTASKIASVISIPGYEIKDLLGRGGMAMVYLAVQKSIEREVALKVLSPDHTDDTFSERFLREARIASQLAHPNIITIFDAGIHNDIHYMSMEYIKGKNFNEARDLLSRKQKITIIKEMALALDFASKKGFVHRDIKPENILLHHDGRAVLTDFGIAKASDVSKGLTETGKILGTPYFMSPEQTKGLQIDHRTDIYSLGVVLFQALTGYVPYDGPSLVSICIKHLSDPIPQLPKGLEIFQTIINTCMSKNPEHRYQHASALYDALNNITSTQLDKIDATAKQFKKTAKNYNSSTMFDSDVATPNNHVSPPIKKPAERIIPSHNYIKPEQSTLITESNDFIKLNRRKKNILLLLIILAIAVGYYRKNELAELWRIQGKALANKYLPPELKKYLPIEEKYEALVTKKIKHPIKPGTPLDIENENIKKLLLSIDKIPSNAQVLAQLYNKRLITKPDDNKLLTDITRLKNWYLNRVASLTKSKDFIKASQTVKIINSIYPELKQTERLYTLENKLELDKRNEPHLQKARVYFAVNALNTPQGANALEHLRIVINTDPENKEALAGLNKISEHFKEKAINQFNNKKYFKALNSINSSLQSMHDDPELLNLQQKIKSSINSSNQLSDLLKKSKKLLSEGHSIEPRGESAYDIYKIILKQDPGNITAQRSLNKIHNKIVKEILIAINQNQFQSANKALSTAKILFKDSPDIQTLKNKLKKEMDAVLPIIPKIQISSTPFNKVSQTNLQKVKIGQRLYVGFEYNNFTQEKTKLTANLYNGNMQKIMIQKSLTINGKQGTHFFTLQLPKNGITNGNYSIELLLGNSRLIKANLFGIH